MLPVNYALVVRALDIELRALARLFWRPLLAAATMYAAVTWLLDALPIGVGNPLVRLVIAAVAGAALYFTIVFFLWSLAGRPAGAETLVQQRLSRAKNAPPAAAPAKE
jgi:hypothetical protein